MQIYFHSLRATKNPLPPDNSFGFLSFYAEGVRQFQPSVGAKRLRWEIGGLLFNYTESVGQRLRRNEPNGAVDPRVGTLGSN